MLIDKKKVMSQFKDVNKIETGLMPGVNQGFHDSVLPKFAVDNYSHLDSLKPELRGKDAPIAQDLGLRMGSQLLSKVTVGAAALAAARLAQSQYLSDEEFANKDSMYHAFVPAIGAAWYASSKANDHIPTLHKKMAGKNSIYK